MVLNWFLVAWLSFTGLLFNEDLPEFKGGSKNLISFINQNLIYPEYSKQNCIQGTIDISFKLNHKGIINSSKVQKGLGIDLDQEALRIVRLTSKKWKVPISFDTTQSIIIPITFSLKEYNCQQQSSRDIKEAIDAYKARQGLTNVIFNYYQTRSAGSYSAADEVKIMSLKAQLGYDEKFTDKLLKQALRKIKQGDLESSCEDLNFIRKLGSPKAEKYLAENCK